MHKPDGSASAVSEFLDRPGVLELLLVAAAFLCYVGTLRFSFVYDDAPLIVDNAALRSWAAVPGYFTQHFWAGAHEGMAANYYRPVLLLWLRANYLLFGLHASGWHATTVLLHVFATLLVFRLARQYTGSAPLSAGAALLFAVHPVHVESVAWVSGCGDILATVFLLAATLCFLTWWQSRQLRWWICSLVLSGAALLTKETAVLLPLLLAISAWAINARPEASHQPCLRRGVAGVLPFLALAGAYFWVRTLVLHGVSQADGKVAFATMALTWPSVLLFYLRQLVMPWRSTLYYDLQYVRNFTSAQFLVSIVLLLCLGLLVGKCIRRSTRPQALIAALLWVVLPIAPVLYLRVFRPEDLVHDRFLYAATVGFCIAAAIAGYELADWFAGRSAAVRKSALALATAIFAVMAFTSQAHWVNDMALFSHAVSMSPHDDVAAMNLGILYMRQGNSERGIPLLSWAAENYPQNAVAQFNLGKAYSDIRDNLHAQERMRRALTLDPMHPEWWLQYSAVELRLGNAQEAIGAARRAVELQPSGVEYHTMLGLALLGKGDRQGAREAFEQELALHPNSVPAAAALKQVLVQ